MKLILYLRSFVGVCAFIFFTLNGCLLTFSNILFRSSRFADWIISTWAKLTIWVFNIDIEVYGRENWPTGGCLFLFNHTTDLDIPVACAVGPRSSRFGAKVELFSIPLFGAAMRVAGMLPIARAERSKVLKLYDESIARVHRGERFYLAAEGTRQPIPGVGERFKSGPFIFAISGQFPINPIVIRGAGELMPKGHLLPCTGQWRSRVKISYLPPISTNGLTLDDRERLTLETREKMAKVYEELAPSNS